MRIRVGVSVFAVGLLAGCSSNSFHNPTNASFTGKVMGGEQAITGATVQLYAVNTSTNGGASTPLISATVTTSDGSGMPNSNANAGNNYNTLPAGYFTITGDYTCPSAGTQVYLTATGGNPGLSAGTNNTTIQQLLALGACGQLSSSTSVSINEATTVGSIAALYPYMTAYNAIGSTSGNASYLAEEFSLATEYMNAASGKVPGPNLPGGFYASSNEINALANVLFTCVNSMGATPGDGSNCGSLLNAAKPSAGVAPTNTVGIVLDALNNPTNNVAGIYSYISTTPPFAPYDSTAPSDWTLPILPLPQTPTASPSAGTYAGPLSVTLTSQTSGVTIYYTTDGSTPTTSSSVYSGPVSVSSSGTLKAIAANSRSGSSAAVSNTYTLTGAAATPVISLAAGTYSTPQTYTITSATPDAAIYVTTDGTTPSASSTLVTGSLQLDKTETVKAIAIAGSSSSSVATAAYTYLPTSQIINTVAGGSTNGDNVPATTSALNLEGVALDTSGNLYIADYGNNRVRKVTAATGIITTVAGNGTAGYSGDNGLATSAKLNGPVAVAVDTSGNLYIVDQNNQRVRKVTAANGYITTIAGNGTQCTTSATTGCMDGGQGTNAELDYPFGVAVDASGNVYIADSNSYRIRKVTAAGVITTVAGNGTYGYTGDGTAATSAEMENPIGVAVDASGNLFIVDEGDARIREVVASTGIISTVAGGGTNPSGCTGSTDSVGDGCSATSATFSVPYDVVVDASGNLYISDEGHQRIRKVTAATGSITTVVGNGTTGYTFSADGSVATNIGLYNPQYVAVDANGNLYYADTRWERVREVPAATGLVSTVAGYGPYGYGALGDSGAATSAVLSLPTCVTLDANGNLYIADYQNNRIRKLTAATGEISTVAGNGIQGYSGDNGAATSAELFEPYGVAVDSSGNLYIADYGNNRVRKVTAGTGIITTVAGTGGIGYSGDNIAATSATLYNPVDVALDSSGNIYISDWNNQRVRKVTVATGMITTVAGNGTGGYSGDGSAATNAEIKGPYGLAFDSSGNLYIADAFNNRIRKVTGTTISTIAGNGTACTTSATTGCSDGSAATSAELNFPTGVAFDSSGNLYIADNTDHRIRKVTGTTISTVAGTGTAGYTGDGSAATSAEIDYPESVALDSSNNLYIADYSNNRIRVVYH